MLILESVDYHRNGVGGEGFHVVMFTDTSEDIGGPRKMMGIVFPKEKKRKGDWFPPIRVAVLDREMAGTGDARFGYNSWRGDHYSDWLYAATKHDAGTLAWALRNRNSISPKEAYEWAREWAHNGRIMLAGGEVC